MIERDRKHERVKRVEPGINVFTGPMFSGKSDTLIRELRKLPFAGYKVQVFFPKTDIRRNQDTVNSYDGATLDATPIENSNDLLRLVDDDTDVVGIDEAQFADMGLVDACIKLAKNGKTVFVAGLDRNFKGEPFGPMANLKMFAENVVTFHAYCTVCLGEASFTQRMVIDRDEDGNEIGRRPANYNDPLVVLGGDEKEESSRGKEKKAMEYYEARCREHHEVPGRPERKWIFVAEVNE